MNPIISACICTYDRYDLLPKAVDSLLNQSLEKELYKIIIVDNSPDLEKAQNFSKKYQNFSNIIYIIEKEPGLSNARNVALNICETEYIAYMDDDAIATFDWLKNLLYGFETFSPDVAVVGGKVEPIFEVEPPLWLHDSLLSFLSIVDWGGNARIAEPSEWFAGTNIAFHTKTLLELGGFNVKLGRIGSGASLLSNEEIQVIKLIRSQNKKLVYVPEAAVKHLVESKRLTQEWFRKRVAWQAVSDFMSDFNTALNRVKNGWDWVMEYFFKLPPKLRNINSLYINTDSPELFRHQLDAIYLLTISLLNGFEFLGK